MPVTQENIEISEAQKQRPKVLRILKKTLIYVLLFFFHLINTFVIDSPRQLRISYLKLNSNKKMMVMLIVGTTIPQFPVPRFPAPFLILCVHIEELLNQGDQLKRQS